MRLVVQREASHSLVDAVYRPILAAAVDGCRNVLGLLARNIRMMGSIPRGKALIGVSDADFISICKEKPSKDRLARLDALSAELTRAFPVVSKVDLETEVEGAVDPAREFVFRTDSISLDCTDLYAERQVEIENTELVKLVTPSLEQILTGYSSRLAIVTKPAEVRFMSRVTGKDILKCFREHLLLQHGIYVRTVAEIHKQLAQYYPWNADLLDLLHGLYENPTTDKGQIVYAIDLASKRSARFTVKSG